LGVKGLAGCYCPITRRDPSHIVARHNVPPILTNKSFYSKKVSLITKELLKKRGYAAVHVYWLHLT
jgi:hypothetical protein